MAKAITIREAKANFLKYVERAKSGKPVIVGAYGKEEVILIASKPKKSATRNG